MQTFSCGTGWGKPAGTRRNPSRPVNISQRRAGRLPLVVV